MKHVKKWKKFNELNNTTYYNAADGLRSKHSNRADELEDHARNVGGTINTSFGPVALSDLIHKYQDGFGVEKDGEFKLIYSSSETNIIDRKSAIAFRNMVKSGDFRLDDEDKYEISKYYDSEDDFKEKLIKYFIEYRTINDIYRSE